MSYLALAFACAFSCQTPRSQVAYTDASLALERTHVDMIRDDARLSTELPRGFLLSAHDIASGSGVVLRLREDHPGRSGRSDSGYFEMLSIYLPQSALNVGESVDLGKKGGGAIAYYSTANYGFLDKGGCHGYAESGNIIVEAITEVEIRAIVEVHVNLVDPSGFADQCASIEISGSFNFHTRATVGE